MRRTFGSVVVRFVALGALAGAPLAHAQPRDITLPELLGGPEGDAIRAPDMMPVPKPTVSYLDDDGRDLTPKAKQAAPLGKVKPAAKPKPVAESKTAAVGAKTPAKSPPAARSKTEQAALTPSARAKTTPTAKVAPPLRTIQIARTPQQAAPGRVPLPADTASAPDLAALPEPQAEVAQEETVPDMPASEAPGEAMQASGESNGFGPEFSEIEAAIQRGARRGDFTRRQAADLYAELDDIAAMDDYYTRSGRGDRARVADRLADLRNYLARQTGY